MKRSISLVMCLVMLVSIFSVLGVTAGAAATDLMYVKTSGFKNDKITYTVYLKENITLSGAVVHAKFDSSELQLVSAGAYMVDDGDGGTRENISGMYEAGYYFDTADNRYCVGYACTGKVDYNVGSKAKAFIQFTFKAVDDDRPKTTVNFYCYEFKSINTPENNIENGSTDLICSDTRTTLGETKLASIASANGGVKITWNKTTGADSYRVYKKVDGKYTGIADVTTTSYTDTDVANNNVYQYTVRAMNEAGLNSSYDSAGLKTRYLIAPSSLKVAIGVNSVSASWSKVSGAKCYRLYRREVKADGTYTSWTLIAKDTTALKFTDSTKTLESNKTYQYCIRALTSDGGSATYRFATINYVATPTVKAAAAYSGVKVTWSKVDGAVKYRIYRKVSGEKSWTKLKDVGGSTFSYTDTKAPNNKKIYYTVKAFTEEAGGAYKAVAVNYLKAPVAKVANTASGVKVSWGKISGAKQYIVYRKAAGATSWSRLATITTNSYTDKNVKSGTKYTYTVRAVNGSVKSSYNSAGFTIEFLSRPKLSSAVSSKSGITVKWGAVTGSKGYVVYRKTGSNSWSRIATVNGKTTVSYLDKTAKKGVTYTYTVRAFDGSSMSSYYSGISCKDKY